MSETMSPALVLRPWREADSTAIATIYGHYVANSVCTFDFDAPDATAMRLKFAAMVEKGHPVVVGEVEGVVAGYAYASDYRPRLGYRFTCEDSIYLAPEMVGRGYGRLLLADIIGKAQAFGFRQMLAVIAGGIESSIRLHAGFGFEVRGTYPRLGHKFGDWVDIVHMQKAL